MFFTSKIFYEILNHFKNLSTEENKKYVYAKYKTIYLKKCFDNNITPEPGSPKNEDAVSGFFKKKKINKNVNINTYIQIYTYICIFYISL